MPRVLSSLVFWTRCRSVGLDVRISGLPNKRLKLAGGDRFRGSGVLCPSAHELSFDDTAREGRVARSLSASR